MVSEKPTLFFLVGPTASGKTEYAVSWARRYGAEILSCDSLAVYKGMDIGTAKPSPRQREEIPHWGLDLVHPEDSFSVYRYQCYAHRVVKEILERGNRVLVVGGSGFYLKSFFAPVADDIPETAFDEVRRWAQRETASILLHRLMDLNNGKLPPGFDASNPRRIQNALARCWATRLSLEQLQTRMASIPFPLEGYEKKLFRIHLPLEILKIRLRFRIDAMFHRGWLEEVHALVERDPEFEHRVPAQSVGYREIVRFLKISHPTPDDEARLREEIFTRSVHLIKKQNTWFRTQIPGTRFAEGYL
ncbi:MAG: tRNA (adenosine(37)-N6)-dimethylallyltransferase MiaA [Puniceicoccales bacterium]|jgi:tRNA dimethylallyltransferase|nr:tRNA (adenosine(37)-N6)-dimethylallyltransferase MiaA [Puniceicoccales bacterium]